ncbi:putative B3 domain-containing protein At5g35780 [Ziziphus jujuba]|uniref:B3 domain-containing protein At5g35780 n=1 Tax=Ziziphus jujuba TaxID=326968 RepID=A0A6P4BJJ2_ZIZJJ|nr:putative B3 domain-containing protein At5g35780 [Ziziphus jujuba]
MRLLNKEDFEGFDFKIDQSGIDMLADICGVALEVLEQETRRRLKGKEIVQQHRLSPPPSLLKSYQKENETKAGDQIVHGLKLKIPKVPSSNKISRTQEENYDDDDDWDMIQAKNSKKRSRNQEAKDDADDWDITKVKNSEKSTKRRKRPSNFVRRPVQAADRASYQELPGEFMREIEAMRGKNIKLGIQKQLTETDLKAHHNRLLIPVRQIIDGDFLTDAEKSILSRHQVIEDIPLLMKQPNEERMEVMNINMTQWDMAKQFGKASSCNYVLRTSWQDVARTNRLQKDDVVQIWSFRVQEDTLHLALVVVHRANHQLRLSANTGSTSTAGSAGTNESSTGNNGSSSSSGSSGNTYIC